MSEDKLRDLPTRSFDELKAIVAEALEPVIDHLEAMGIMVAFVADDYNADPSQDMVVGGSSSLNHASCAEMMGYARLALRSAGRELASASEDVKDG